MVGATEKEVSGSVKYAVVDENVGIIMFKRHGSTRVKVML